MNLKNAALLTHKNCMDGSTCAIVFCAAGGKRENIVFSSPNHDETDEKFADLLDNWDGPIIVADASVSVEMAETVCNYDNLVLLDHHKSAIPLSEYPWAYIEKENSRAGGKMLYDFLIERISNPESLRAYQELVDAADDHDRWIKNIPESDTIATLHNVLGQKLFVNRFLKNPNLSLTNNEQYLLNLEDFKREEYIENRKKEMTVREVDVNGESVRVAFLLANNHQSRLGHAIYEDITLGVDVVVMVGNKSISMRSKQDCPLDLSVVAKLNGGGGHAAAAGCDLGKVLGQDLVEFVIERLKLQ